MLQARTRDAERACSAEEDSLRAIFGSTPIISSPEWMKAWSHQGRMMNAAFESLSPYVDRGAFLLSRTAPGEGYYDVTYRLFHAALDVLQRIRQWQWQRRLYAARYPELEE